MTATKIQRGSADPRPVVAEEAGHHVLLGSRCRVCAHALASRPPRCRRCRGALEPARFGPNGTIWAVTVVHLPSERSGEAPYMLGYVDLDDGPRVLLRLDAARSTAIGARVRLTAPTREGNPAAEMLG